VWDAEHQNPACLYLSKTMPEGDDINDGLGTGTPEYERADYAQLLIPVCDSGYSCTGCCITSMDHSTDISYSKHFISTNVRALSHSSSSLRFIFSHQDISLQCFISNSFTGRCTPSPDLYKSSLFQQSLAINLTRRSSRRKSDPIFKADFHDRMADFRCSLELLSGPTTT
jgi:hypothetical protein